MSETAAPKKKTLKVAEVAVDGVEPVEAAANVAVPFANFLPFIEETAMDLNKEFDSTIQLLEFAFMVDFSLRDDIDNKKIRADIEDLIENLQAIGGGGGIFDPNKNVSTIMDKSETNIFQSELLPYNDFEEVEVGENVADESSNEETKNNIKNQVTILRKLEECDYIIQFFGLTTADGNKLFLVTEWAEHEVYISWGPLG
ncbi:unnamed protein product [Rhizophagus irregularis]|nr:unnamed protein product [Rhizophagus irregularis]